MNLRVTNERFEVFYDGACSLCSKEISLLRKLDKHNRIEFTDIADANFDAQAQTGLSYEALMESIYGKMPDGSLVNGVEVFRQLYGRVGFKALMPLTRLPIIQQTLDGLYEVFAKNRLRLTGRCETGESCRIDASSRPDSL